MTELITDIRCGDCQDVLRQFDDEQFDLIITSPPYADSRDKTYGGIKPGDYSEIGVLMEDWAETRL